MGKRIDPSFYSQITERNSSDIKEKIKLAVVGIAGCGGLGSNAAIALARIGIKKLIIADFDKVEPSNLNRQQFFIRDIGKYKTDALGKFIKCVNPFIIIEKHNIKLTLRNIFSIYSECPIIIEAFDKVSEKSMILKAFGDVRFGKKYLITASGLAGYYSSNFIKTKKLSTNIFLCGDNQNEGNEKNGLMAPRVMIAAGHQANAAVNLISKIY
ncbi:MAG: sulfur carrier protein ThiS adenylyltransferase ThiF [Ignavibacteriaceae bacterium]|nr:sulfur carrier protein ThiS adenylyltransferase ThiF [Ignavibacteriaceae bacterium]